MVKLSIGGHRNMFTDEKCDLALIHSLISDIIKHKMLMLNKCICVGWRRRTDSFCGDILLV